MTEKEIRGKYERICFNLSERKLKPSFDLLGNLMEEEVPGILHDECENLEQTYHYMLQYTVEGINDPERQKVYRHLIISVYELADKVYESIRLKQSSSLEYQKKRNFEKLFISNYDEFFQEIKDFYANEELNSLVNKALAGNKERNIQSKNHQQKIVKLFNHLWLRDKPGPEETDFIQKLLDSEELPVHYKSLMITGITLSLLRFFNEIKFSLLFGAFEKGEPEVRQRALAGLLICFFKYDKRLPFYPEITGRLKILNEDPKFKQNLEWMIIQFIRTRETEKIQQKIRDEIIPEMIKISPNLRNKINLDSLMGEGSGDEKNPEWEEIFQDSPGLLDKMEEFSELQMEGADVFLGSFAMLKSFPFFSEISNWFIPFFIGNPDLESFIDTSDEVNRQFMEIIGSAPILCNSDKHSFCFSVQNLPEENREMIAQGMKAEIDQLNEMGEDEELTMPGKKEEYISNQYLQDLYRFYKLHPRHSDFEDVFGWRFDFYNKIAIGDILKEDKKVLREIAEFYFAKNHFDEAAEIYNILTQEEKSGELYQKIAFCYQKQGYYKKALDAYLKAELYELNKLWNLKKIAFCYRNLKDPAKALEYYRQAELLDAENLNIQLWIGHCLLELDQFDEALKCYFKVEYLSPGNKKVWRPIGWCSFLTGKKKQAEKYYKKLVEDAPTPYDLMNMGHVQWSLGNRKIALDYYKRSITENGFTENEFIDIFDEDLRHLIDQGIDKEDVPIMLDQLRYSIEG